MHRRVSLAAAGTCACVLLVLPVAFGADSAPAPGTASEIRTGTPQTVAAGITETVDQIMARSASEAAPAGVESIASPDAPLVKKLDAAAASRSQWPTTISGGRTGDPGSAPQTAGTNFKAIGLSESGFIPPDVAGDVGPTQILVHVNGRVRVFSKNGASGALNTTASAFWSSVANGSQPVYPQVRYDRLSGRWILLAVNSAKPNNRVMIAVQTTPGTITATTSFTFYQFNQNSGGNGNDASNVCDSPKLGVDGSALYIGCNMFNNSGTFTRVTVYVVRKSSLIPAPGTLVVTAFRDIANGTAGPGPFDPLGVDDDEAAPTVGYFIGVDVANLGQLQLRRVTDPGGTPSLSGNIPLTVLATAPPILQPTSGSSVNLDSGDDRLAIATIHKNKLTGAVTLSTVHGNEVDASCVSAAGGGRNGARWYEIAGSVPTASDPLAGSVVLVQSGTLCDTAPSDPQGYIFPSVAVNGQGALALGATVASPNLFAGAASAGRLRLDPPGLTEAPTTLQSGLASYTFVTAGHNRWGDYSFTGLDPTDDQTFWTFQEYADSTRNNWAVRAVQLKAPPPPALSGLQAAVCVGSQSASVTLTGTANSPVTGSEFFDPGGDPGGPGFVSRISATATGGVVVNGIPSLVLPANPATDPVLSVTLSLDTTSATTGLKSITIKNPDGQGTTGTSVVRVDQPQNPVATSSSPVCVGGTLQLSAPSLPGASYSWTGPNGFTSSLQNPSVSSVTFAAAGTYTVTFSGTGCPTPQASTVVQVPGNGGACEDGNACTTGDTCSAGTCQPGAAVVCDDHNVCTSDSCNPATGCVFTDVTATLCGDGNACTDDLCDPTAGCSHANNTAPCQDGNPCTSGDVCGGGACHPGAPTNCDDGNACTADACNPQSGCTHTDISASCNDNNVCTADSCNPATGCVHTDTTATACDDHNVCTNDLCDPSSGCFHTAASGPCDDGNACTTGDVCSGGTCTGGAPLVCDDNNVCTSNGCNPATGCVYVDTTATTCNDGNVCTDDHCDPVTGCYHTDNAAPCSDGNACTTGDECDGGACVAGGPRNCNDNNVCTDDSCDPATGCVHTANTLSCDDGSACTTGDSCSGGTCHGGAPVVCNDDLVCTTDTCVPAIGCVFQVNTEPCDDGNACTTGDRCSQGVCQPGDPIVCDDGNPCTTDRCYEDTGCDFQENTDPCDDGNPCTTGDVCSAGACQPGPPTICNDGSACTHDFCDPAHGCEYIDISAICDDDDACTVDGCSPATGCFHSALSCDDGNVCTDDACDSGSGCTHTPNSAACDDSSVCTLNDTCINGMCLGNPIVCDDGNACTANSCDPVTGCFFPDSSASCDDGNVCTDDSCDPATGCHHVDNTLPCSDGSACTAGDTCGGGVCHSGPVIVCDDGNPCTSDACNPASGCVFTPLNCDDGNPCTNDSCNPATGCTHVNNTASCTDNNACTVGDVCGGGTCHPGTLISCNDDNPCTVDACDPATGCKFTALNCDDNNKCTADSCDPQTGCVHTDISAACNLGHICNDDSCDPILGCLHIANTNPCDDGNACTTGDTCHLGICVPSSTVTCNDGNACTTDTCDPLTGCVFTDSSASCNDGNVCTDDSCNPSTGCVHTPAAGACSDGNACTSGDFCSGGTCQPGAAITCNDGNACTADSCNPATGCVFTPISCDDGNVCTNDGCNSTTGCVHTNNTLSCNDGNACTVGDVCGGGTCHPGAAVACNDNNVCTSDSCNPATGCVFTDNTEALCGDGNACTDDFCDPSTAACSHAFNTAPCNDGNGCTGPDTCSAGLCAGPVIPPPEVSGVREQGKTSTTLSWTAVIVPSGYDVVTSTLANLRVSGTSGATCLADNVSGTSTVLSQAQPSPGTGYFYLVRSQGTCGTGSYGFATGGGERIPASGCP